MFIIQYYPSYTSNKKIDFENTPFYLGVSAPIFYVDIQQYITNNAVINPQLAHAKILYVLVFFRARAMILHGVIGIYV